MYRLNFFDLRNDTGLNNLSPEEKQQIWIPELVFDNTEFKPSTVADPESSGTIEVLIVGANDIGAPKSKDTIKLLLFSIVPCKVIAVNLLLLVKKKLYTCKVISFYINLLFNHS